MKQFILNNFWFILVIFRLAVKAPKIKNRIVNPANSYGYMGGGVAWVIKNVGGAIIEEEAIAQARFHIGTAVLTSGGGLIARHVIHSPTMEEPAEKTNVLNIQQAVQAALELADQNQFTKIAFPGMGTGVGGVGKKEAAQTMVKAIKAFPAHFLKEVVFQILQFVQ